ncbi:hypothetical protein FJV41_10170 [Myxococcus llanfairpwllgwyngyllgogerychwyrndrobwllllantysiliogogogochensis]|uniref:Uncharacterized protein n=1 Tax=Myxococcus llanfairpwllgwyngyllgogerychwyrndrobwllllantysiliogogogochensis TaxID=2590453 RepID=A0A540X474_9BACT|nr:hypothetical protein [Myxococcus llanfairpwllgwyngyllgogerychwyrndrobwllllantysiliogogogochensis]TQF16038.1 hypothetical protein FJV41_10170 [Myxococcus llanfairpwllgwyngyllgogerychwyrndrobwllllantysiliogogogochensis]
MKDVDLWSEHVEWLKSLSLFLGCPLRIVQGSETIEVDAASATLEGMVGTPHPGLTIELVVKLLVTRKDDCGVAVWALVFFFIDKRRVAEQGKCCLAVEWREGQWSRRGWESDADGEWAGLETLE